VTFAATDHTTPAPDEKRWWILLVLCLSLLIVVIGNTVVNVTLPRLVHDLGATTTELQWIVASYALVFAGLLLTAGALGDRYGRKRALFIGMAIFAAGSITGIFGTTPAHLIVARSVMGIGAAAIMPATLSILVTVFPPFERAKAIAIWAGVAGAGVAIGPVTGGWLLDHFWWGSVFSINLPLVVLALVSGWYLVPDSRDPRRTRLDPIGALLSIVGLTSLLYGIIEAPEVGWTEPLILGCFAVATVVLAAFAVWENHTTHPMLDLRFFQDRAFSAGSVAVTLNFFALFGAFFMLTQYLQFVQGYSPLESGVRTLPNAVVMMLAAPQSARVAERFGTKRTVGTALAIVALGILLLSQCTVGSPYGYVALGLCVTAVGMGLSMPPSTAAIMSGVPMAKAGVGSAMNDTTRELGGALGVAVIGSVLSSHYTTAMASAAASLPETARPVALSSVGGAINVASTLGAGGSQLADAAKIAFVDGMELALLLGALTTLLASALVFRLMPARIHHRHVPAVEPEAELAVRQATTGGDLH
jgi:EmrB/QacA subfamily drug resistance transporter